MAVSEKIKTETPCLLKIIDYAELFEEPGL